MLRNFISYLGYIIRLNKLETGHVIIGFVTTIYSLFSSLTAGYAKTISSMSVHAKTIQTCISNTNPFTILAIWAAWLFVTVLYSFYFGFLKKYREYSRKRCGMAVLDRVVQKNIENLTPSDYDNKLKYEIVSIEVNKEENKYERVLHSKYIDKVLQERGHELKIRINTNRPKEIKQKINNYADAMTFLYWKFIQSFANCQDFYNQYKLCLSSDIDPNGKEVTCHKGSYYDTYLTNIISIQKIRSNKDHTDILADGTRLFPFENEEKTAIKSVADSLLNNEIGVSTVGLTKDNYILLWTQNSRAQSSMGLLVPTGSGSCDWTNRCWLKRNSFEKVITTAMNKELWEESCPNATRLQKIKSIARRYADVGDTKLIGYYRWLAKGGKSEFLGVTRLLKNKEDYKAHEKEVYAGTNRLCRSFNDFKSEISILQGKTNISVPLYMNLLCLRQYMEDPKNSGVLEKFLFPKGR